MNNPQHFASAQWRYENQEPDDDGDVVEEMDCPECGTEVNLRYGKGTCTGCQTECEY